MGTERRCVLCHRPLPVPRNWLGRFLDRINPPPPSCLPPAMRECHRAFAERVGLDPKLLD